MTQKTAAALSLELVPPDGDSVPEEAHLLPAGEFRATDGRPRELKAWRLDEAAAQAVIARAAAKSNDTLIDFEHQSLHAEWNGQPAPAAGWFRELQWRAGGLFAAGIRWTDRARKMIASREYRYISAVFNYLPSTGEVLEIISVALTNTPALDGLEALVTARKTYPQGDDTQEETDMADEASRLAALTAERDAAAAELAALKTKLKEGNDELAALKAKIEADAQAAERAECGRLIEAALKDGHIAPAQKAMAEKLGIDLLREFIASSKELALLTRQHGGKPEGTAALTQEEAAIAARLSVTHEQFLKAKE
jgi:phage I-like protein